MVAAEQVEGSRRSLRHLPVAWTRFEVGSGGGAGSVSLALAARGERVPLGRHRPDARRARLGEELKIALREAVPA